MIFDPVTMATIQIVPEGGLEKGQQALLNVIDPTVRRVIVSAGWQAPAKNNSFDVDIDLSAFMLRPDGKVRQDSDFVFYNNTEAENGGIVHNGTVEDMSQGDRESVMVDFEAMHYGIEKVAFVLSIHNCEERTQFFDIVKLMFIRVINAETGAELIRYNLKEEIAESNVLHFGELIRDGMGWNFHATGEGAAGGLYQVARDYNVNVAPV